MTRPLGLFALAALVPTLAAQAPSGVLGFYRVSRPSTARPSSSPPKAISGPCPVTGGLARRLTSHPARGERPGDLAGRQHAGLHRALRRTGRALHHAACRRRPGAPDLGGRAVDRHRLDPGRQAGLHHHALRRTARTRSWCSWTSRPGHRAISPARRGHRSDLRRHRAHALLRPARLPQQRHQALHRRHGAPDLEVRAGGAEGGGAHQATTAARAIRRCGGTAACISSATATAP